LAARRTDPNHHFARPFYALTTTRIQLSNGDYGAELAELFHDTLKDIYFAENLCDFAKNGKGSPEQGASGSIWQAPRRDRAVSGSNVCYRTNEREVLLFTILECHSEERSLSGKCRLSSLSRVQRGLKARRSRASASDLSAATETESTASVVTSRYDTKAGSDAGKRVDRWLVFPSR
jgi:hypothetical protein